MYWGLRVITYTCSPILFAGLDFRRLKVVDLGNAIHCIHEELSLYYDDFELQTLLYRAPEVYTSISLESICFVRVIDKYTQLNIKEW